MPAAPFTYTPYADGVKPFSIGLAMLDPARWIEPDDRLAAELAAKDTLLADHFDEIVRAEADTHVAQSEVLAMLLVHLEAAHATTHRRHGSEVEILPAGRRVRIDDPDEAPLLTAARLIQDDLVLMRRGETGWRLVAAVMAAPSKWSLAEKFGQDLDGIHARVPGYAGPMATRMARIFDHLRPAAPVWRYNWSIYDDDHLFHPETRARPKHWSGADGEFGATAYVRVERQTLRRLPVSGDIVFTIRVYVDAVAAFRTHPEGRRYAAALAEKLAGFDASQLAYKGLLADRDTVLAGLREFAGA